MRLPWRLAMAGLALLAVSCGDGGLQGQSMDEDVRDQVAAQLDEQGREAAAEIVRDRSGTSVEHLETPYLSSWAVYQFDRQGPSGETQHIVATDGQQSLLLRAAPDAFETVLRTDGASVDDEDVAIDVVRDYLFMTRPTDMHSYLVEDVDDIQLRTDATDADRAELAERLGDVIEPPQASSDGAGHRVTAFVVYGNVLQRHVVIVGPDGIDEQVEVVAEDLPVPFSL
jgi:hypothetical protein